MTDAQAGGIKGRATVDHILILKELANISINQSINQSNPVLFLYWSGYAGRPRGKPRASCARAPTK